MDGEIQAIKRETRNEEELRRIIENKDKGKLPLLQRGKSKMKIHFTIFPHGRNEQVD